MGDILAVCIEAARAAGDYLKANFGKEIAAIQRKPDQSLVTNLDKEAEQIITERILKTFPDHGILGEESVSTEGASAEEVSAEDGSKGNDHEYLWIIDPLDGTHNFIRGMGLFGVSIGVVHRDEFIAGVINMPVRGELYTAEKGKGAFKNGKPIQVSNVAHLPEATVVYDSDIRTDRVLKLDVLGTVAENVFNLRMFGSSACNLTYLAEGKIDAIIEFNDKPWDFAGGACILREAGGTITGFDGRPLSYKTNGYVAGNGKIQAQILDLCKNKIQ